MLSVVICEGKRWESRDDSVVAVVTVRNALFPKVALGSDAVVVQ